MKKAFSVLAMSGTLFSSPLCAADWLFLGKTSSQASVYVDTDTITSLNSYRVVWDRILSFNEEDLPYETKDYELLDCGAHTMATISHLAYDKDGKVTDSYTVPAAKAVSRMEPVAPETVGELVLKAGCRQFNAPHRYQKRPARRISDPRTKVHSA